MTSNTMPATQYKDPKKYMWLLSVIAPFAAPLGPIMYLYTGHTQWLWIFLAFFYLGLPVLDFVFGEDKQNPPEQAVPELENTKYYRVITYLLVPIITFGFLFNVVFEFLATEPCRVHVEILPKRMVWTKKSCNFV